MELMKTKEERETKTHAKHVIFLSFAVIVVVFVVYLPKCVYIDRLIVCVYVCGSALFSLLTHYKALISFFCLLPETYEIAKLTARAHTQNLFTFALSSQSEKFACSCYDV